MTEQEMEQIVRDEARQVFKDYYRRGFPGFEITSGGDTTGHGEAEYCMTTKSAQGLHFYKQGNMKMRAIKSMELYTGDSEDVWCRYGSIYDDGRRTRNITFSSKKKIF